MKSILSYFISRFSCNSLISLVKFSNLLWFLPNKCRLQAAADSKRANSPPRPPEAPVIKAFFPARHWLIVLLPALLKYRPGLDRKLVLHSRQESIGGRIIRPTHSLTAGNIRPGDRLLLVQNENIQLL